VISLESGAVEILHAAVILLDLGTQNLCVDLAPVQHFDDPRNVSGCPTTYSSVIVA
jgi:hypothetical protein